MSIQPVPKTIAEEVSNRLSYKLETDIDHFTLKNYQYKLQKLYNEEKATDDEYEALAKVYFNLKKYDKYVELLIEGIERFKAKRLLHSYTMGRMMLFGLANRSFDLMSEWFNHELNPNKESFDFVFVSSKASYLGHEFHYQKEVRGSILIDASLVCFLEFGPFRVTQDYRVFDSEGFDFSSYIIMRFAEYLQTGALTDEQLKFFIDILGKNVFDKIKRLSRDYYKTERIPFRKIPQTNRELSRELVVTIIQENDFYYAINSDLKIYEGAESKEDALSEFFALFDGDLLNWVEIGQEEVSPDALDYRNHYLSYIKQ